MIEREDILEIVQAYDMSNLHIGVLGSHSALDVIDGAKDEGLATFVVCQKGRELPYKRYGRLIDKILVLESFADIMGEDVQEKLRENNVVWVPNRSFVVYPGVEKVQNEFRVPMIGTRSILHIEDRERYEKNYYWLCQKAGLPTPREFNSPEEIDRLVMVKIPLAKKKVERGFFTCASPQEYREKVDLLLKQGIIEKGDLRLQRIEEYVVGPVFNFNYFHSPITETTEFLGIDRRLETNLDGIVRIPSQQQETANLTPTYLIVGHTPATIRESQLNMVFKMGDQFVEAAERYFPPGIIGPFCLQTIATSTFVDYSTSELEYVTYDVAVRIGGGTNIYLGVGSQYSKLYYGTPISMGRRIALEVKDALERGRLGEIVT
ncbi:MAG: DUF1297 domain-containing protein [Candidatus Bathyarchaeia archaeon]